MAATPKSEALRRHVLVVGRFVRRAAGNGSLGCVALTCLAPLAVATRRGETEHMASWLAAIAAMAAIAVALRERWIEAHVAPLDRSRIAGCWFLAAALAPLVALAAVGSWDSPFEGGARFGRVEVVLVALRFAALGVLVTRARWTPITALLLFGAVAFLGPAIATGSALWGRLGAMVAPQSLGATSHASAAGVRPLLADMAGACAMFLAAAALPARVRS